MSDDYTPSHATGGDSAFVDKLRAHGFARKAAPPAGDAGTLSRRLAAIPGSTRAAPVPEDTPYGRMVEVPAPSGTSVRSGAFGPRVRHFRVIEPKTQHRAMGTVTRRPDPTA